MTLLSIDHDLEEYGGGKAGGEFDSYYQSLDAALHLNMETPDSFLDGAVLTSSEQKEHMSMLVFLGQMQRDAPAGNRLDQLERLRRERGHYLGILDAYKCDREAEKFELIPYILDNQEIMDKVGYELQGDLPEYIGGPQDEAVSLIYVQELAEEIQRVQQIIRRDQSNNVFHDFGAPKRLYMFNDRERRYNGLKYLWETWFTQKAIGRACVLMQNTRRGNSQAHHAKMMESIDLEKARVQRSLQRPGRGRVAYANDEAE